MLVRTANGYLDLLPAVPMRCSLVQYSLYCFVYCLLVGWFCLLFLCWVIEDTSCKSHFVVIICPGLWPFLSLLSLSTPWGGGGEEDTGGQLGFCKIRLFENRHRFGEWNVLGVFWTWEHFEILCFPSPERSRNGFCNLYPEMWDHGSRTSLCCTSRGFHSEVHKYWVPLAQFPFIVPDRNDSSCELFLHSAPRKFYYYYFKYAIM